MPARWLVAFGLLLFPGPLPAQSPLSRIDEGEVTSADGTMLRYFAVGSGADTLIVPLAAMLESDLRRLAGRRRVIFYDPRGRGLSSPSLGGAAGAFAADVADLEAVRAHFSLSRLSVLGFGTYALVAVRYAIERPQNVRRLVLVSPPAPRRDPWRQHADERRARGGSGTTIAAQRTSLASVEDSMAFCRRFYENSMMGSAGGTAAFGRDPCRLPNEWRESITGASASAVDSLGSYDWREQLKSLSVPVLIVFGAEGAVPEGGVKEWATAPRARLVSIPFAGDWPFLERADAFFQGVEGFLLGS